MDRIEAPELPIGNVSQLSSQPRLRFAIHGESAAPPALLTITLDGRKIGYDLSGDCSEEESLQQCIKELDESIIEMNSETSIEYIEDFIINKTRCRNFKFEKLPDSDVQIDVVVDLKGGITFGKQKALHSLAQLDDDIGRNIQKAIQRAFDRPAEIHVKSIEEALNQGNHQEAAYIVFTQKNDYLLFSRFRRLLDVICRIDQSFLNQEEANELNRIIVILSSAQHRDEAACEAAEQLLRHDRTLDQQQGVGLRNLIAVGALKRGERETGLAMLHDLLREADQIDADQRGWIWRNLSMALEPNNPEARRTAQLAVDAFLEAGDKQEATRSIVHLSRLQEHDEPITAIRQFDRMLDLMSNEGILDEEIRANILHGKARKMLEHGNSREAFQVARDASDLRRGILGAEEGLISSLHLAAVAARAHGDQQSADAMDEEANCLETEIGSEYFSFARRVTALFESWNSEEANSLLDVARNTDDPEIFAGTHVAIACCDPSLSSLQRLGRMEGVLKELDQRRASSGTKKPARLAIAQILKERGDFSGAVGWYRKILNYAPLDTTVRQNYIDALWKAEEWGDAAIYLRKQLEIYGDLPGLLYAYGRSLFEAGQLSEAVATFTSALKLADDNPDLQNTIRELRERALELGGSIPPPMTTAIDAPVTLDEVRTALKDFANFVSASKRMDFWRKQVGAKRHEWRTQPERHGQTLLHTYFKATFKERVDIFEEIGVGAGRLDLLVRFTGGVSAIIELKMCGYGYSTEYARSGEDQVEHYMNNRKVHMGFLVTFDARQRNNGSKLIDRTIYPKNTIDEIMIDVRPTVVIDQGDA